MSLEKLDTVDKTETATLASATTVGDLNLYALHEEHAGRLIIDPKEARLELGDAVASRLKLSSDGTKVLWPQPTDDPEDPQNWTDRRKAFQLFIMTLASIVPDFDSGIGIAAIFGLAKEYNTTPGVINNLTSNWSIFLIAPAGVFAVMFVRKFGRLPVLFWSQLLGLAFLIGCTFAKDLNTFTAMRCLTAFFATAPQVTGLYIVTDMYPFHLQARKLNLWTMGFIISPFLSPFAFGFLVARENWRWSYGIGCMYSAVVVVMIALFSEETMFDRTLNPIPPRPTTGLRYRVETLLGITGVKMAKYRASWSEALLSPFKVIWRPHVISILLFEAMVFGFGIGINVTNAVFLASPPLSFSQYAIAGAYGTPIVSVVLGELIGRYLNDFITNYTVRRNKGVFEAESRLLACYIGVPLYVVGFILLGASIQEHLSVGALIIGWGIAELGVMVTTVAVYAYCNDCFPRQQGEISALLTVSRILGGFSVAYYQVPWAEKHGALQTFGVEAAIVVGLFLLIVPFLQWKGRYLRDRFSM
ncbi:hypothetical protein HGRIS_000403 [Hohenbuehelia grisea]|uniref:Major facilitator superfamily (MFS) profile domain-containing protein n=1 Tax=Hohenbuehelia grisea TaxID=104357 RepID=A0ABR3JQY5_9AGAR